MALLQAFSLVYAPLRRVGPHESPYPGVLVRAGGNVHLLVDHDAAPTDPVFWTTGVDSHVMRALDVTDGNGGTQALVEACREPLAAFLRRRGALGDDEIVTIALGLLRGSRELQRAGGQVHTGRWWLTISGRPVFALGDGERCLTEETNDAIASLSPTERHGTQLLANIAVLAADGARDELWDECDQALFDWVRPGPLRPGEQHLDDGHHLPRRVREISSASASVELETDPGPIARLLGATDSGWRRAIVDTVTSLSGHARSRPGDRSGQVNPPRSPDTRKRRRLLLALVVATLTIAIMWMLWPASGVQSVPDTPVSAPRPAGSETASFEGASVGESQDIPAIASSLLDARVSCGSDPVCLATVMEDAHAVVNTGAANAPAGSRRIELVEDFGDVAVVRVSADAALPQQLVIVARHDSGWLVRDIYDVTDQPAG